MQPRVLIGGTNSGCGKTTVTLAILAALQARGVCLSAFKCGPDYIDPMFHRTVLQIPSYNLDSFFCSGEQLCAQLYKKANDFSVIEGVMGYYDGVGSQGAYSTHTVALQTQTPVILVVNVKGMQTSAGAILHGFCSFRENSRIAGVIFNGASAATYPALQALALAEGLQPLGFLPTEKSLAIESRHLGLITANEISNLHERVEKLGALAEQFLCLDAILALGRQACALPPVYESPALAPCTTIAVARDAAFCFLYEENLDLLRHLGARLHFFNVLDGDTLPENAGGLYLPGGYPELYADQLFANEKMRQAIHSAIACGMPTIAECGGFLYLHRTLDGTAMTGTIEADAYRTQRLQRFGYISLTAQHDNLLCKQGDSIRGHEFHYYDSTSCGDGFTAAKPYSEKTWHCGHLTDTLYAGFAHLYFPANPTFAENFIRKAQIYDSQRTVAEH